MTAVSSAFRPHRGLSRGMTVLLGAACGLCAANLYYAQPLAGPIGRALGLSAEATGLIVTLTQIGYGLGLLLIVPLGDLVENRKLALTLVGLAGMALLAAARSTSATSFLAAAFMIGVGSVAAQVLVPYAAHMAPDAQRGRAVGNVMSGLLLGIMMARPLSSFVAGLSSWHGVFYVSAAAMALQVLVLRRRLPRRQPAAPFGYGALLASMVHLLAATPVLQRRAFYQACLFGAFSLFWTAVPLLLAGPRFQLSQQGIALFALAGVAGSVAAPVAGRVADRGWTRPATAVAILTVVAAFALSLTGAGNRAFSLGLLVVTAVLVDFGVSGNLTLGQRAIFALGAEYRSRLNGLFMAIFFAGGAVGSTLGGWAYARGGWPLAACVGLGLPLIAFLVYLTEFLPRRRGRAA